MNPVEREIALVFGIRTAEQDFLFKDDFEKLAAKSELGLAHFY